MDINDPDTAEYWKNKYYEETRFTEEILVKLLERENENKELRQTLEKLQIDSQQPINHQIYDTRSTDKSNSPLNGEQHDSDRVDSSCTDRRETDSNVSDADPRPPSQSRTTPIMISRRMNSLGSSGRKLGRRINVKLIKKESLGFSVSTKDNSATDRYPIITKITSPCITNGQVLKPYDKLLQVNKIDMSGKNQEESVQILRNITPGSSVELVIARQESDKSPNPSLPRPLRSDKAGNLPSGCQSEVLTFEIPPNTSVLAGLGISVKGRVEKSDECDESEVPLGLFVNKIINGGTASIDGRLRENDRIISINGKSLVGLSNSAAYDELKKTFVSGDGSGSITITVARYIAPPDISERRRNASYNTQGNEEVTEEGRNTPFLYTKGNDDLDVSTSSFKSCENTVIYKPKTSTSNGDERTNQIHPVSERLRGRSSLRSKSVQNCVATSDPYNSSNRVDVQIENDSETSLDNSLIHTTPKCIDEGEVPCLKTVESMTSLDNDDAGNFHRDGFGRQSISEKRHASLNAKNTDTYQRNKKAKEEKERQRIDDNYDTNHQPQEPSTPVNSNDQVRTDNGPYKPARGDKVARNPLFSPACCWKCQSPGSCPYHVAPHLTVGPPKRVGPNLGLKKSSSLESLQTMMQELQRDQIDKQDVNPFAMPRPATLKIPKNRTPNDNFRAVVDRSYDAAANAQQAMETLSEEGSEGLSSIPVGYSNGSHFSNRPSEAAISLAGTQCTATTGASSQMNTIDYKDDDALIKRKNSGPRKGLIRTLLRFGSGKKKKSPTSKASPPKPVEENTEKLHALRAAMLEQERIQEHYKKFKEQQQQAQIHAAVGIPTHDSQIRVPYYNHRSDSGRTHGQPVMPSTLMGQQAMKLNAHAALYNSTRSERLSNHVRSPSGRTPQVSRHYPVEIRERQDRYDRVHPVPQHQGDPNVTHTRVNSFDVCRETMDRSGSGKFNHYANCRDIQLEQHKMIQQQQQQQHQQHQQHQQQEHGILSAQNQTDYNMRGTYSGDINNGSINPTGEQLERSVPIRRLQMGTNQLINNSIRDVRRKRPLSSYDFHHENMNNSIGLPQNEEIISGQPKHSPVSYGYMQQNTVNFGSLPRHQISSSKLNSVPSNRQVYHPPGADIYSNHYSNDANIQANSSYGSYRFRRDALPPGSKI